MLAAASRNLAVRVFICVTEAAISVVAICGRQGKYASLMNVSRERSPSPGATAMLALVHAFKLSFYSFRGSGLQDFGCHQRWIFRVVLGYISIVVGIA